MTVWSRTVSSLVLPVLLSMTVTDMAREDEGPRRLGVVLCAAVAEETVTTTGMTQAARRCEAYCSRTKAGVSVMEITWSVADQPLAAHDLRARVAQQTLDVTVYDEGFERGAFASASSVTTGRQFQAALGTGEPLKPLPGLENLVITGITTSKDTETATRLRATGADPKAQESVVVQVEGVQPGLYYTWRPAAAAVGSQQQKEPRELITCRAAICPVDVINPR